VKPFLLAVACSTLLLLGLNAFSRR